MAAGPDMTVPALVFAGFFGTTVVTLGGAARALRGSGRNADWAPSLAYSTAATAAGGLLIVDLGVRLLLTSVFEVPLPSRLFQITAWAWFLWSFLVGPGLLLLAFTRRARRQPTRIYALQLAQMIVWMITCLVTLAVAALSGP